MSVADGRPVVWSCLKVDKYFIGPGSVASAFAYPSKSQFSILCHCVGLPAIGSSIRTDTSDDEFLLKETCLALQHSLPRNHSSIIWRKHLRSQLLPKRRRLIIPTVPCAESLGCKVSSKTYFSRPKGVTLDAADFLLARRPIYLRKKPGVALL